MRVPPTFSSTRVSNAFKKQEQIVYTEEEARNLSRILLGAIKYLHNMDVVHRDIKAENVLLSSETDDTSITLADFGFARKLRGRKTNYDCGSAEYKAPEILKGEYYGTVSSEI